MPATTLACRRPLRKLELVGAVGPEACWLIEQLRRWFLETGADLDPVEAEALIDQVQKGEIVAIGPAVAGIERRLSELPRNKEIVAYCRGPYCVLAIDAVRLLRARGLRAHRLEASVQASRA